MADLIAYTDLQTYLKAENSSVAFSADQITVATYCCTAASDAVKTAANRTFEIQGSAAARYFSYTPPANSTAWQSWFYYPWPAAYPFSAMNLTLPIPVLLVDDFFLTNQTFSTITITDYTTSTSYTSSSNRGYPFNADSKGEAFTGIVFAAGTGLPTAEAQLVVTAKWGYVTSIPAAIKNACLLQASRYFKRIDSPFGVAGLDGQGFVMRLRAELDPDVAQMVSTWRRWWAAA